MLTPQLKSKIHALWDKFWSGGIANPLTAIEQISYLLFLRRLDAMDQKRADDAEFLGQKYPSLYEGTYTLPDGKKVPKSSLRWREIRHLDGDALLARVRDQVFPFLKDLKGEEHPFSRAMQDAVFIIPKASLLVEAVGLIDEIYSEIEREQLGGQTFHDTQGDLYEHLLSELQTSGKNGQFRTPRHIIQMMCHLVEPRLGDAICDPAAGTGGFLLGAYQHILTRYTSEALQQIDENGMKRGLVGDRLTDQRQWQVLRHQTFYGYDFDTTMVRIGLMNLILHGIDQPNFSYTDTLSKKFDEQNRYDVVLANPPFKGSIDKGDIHEGLSLKTTKTELLFVNRIIDLLKVGGRAAVIVPDGVLFGSSNAHQACRQLLLDTCELQGVISMPSGVFKPYAGVSTAVIVFVRGGRTENVWFYDMTADGYSLDDKREKIAQNDIPDVITQWAARDGLPVDRKAKAFCVPADEIRANKYDLSINRYKEIAYEAVSYEPPAVILAKMQALHSNMAREMEELGRMVR